MLEKEYVPREWHVWNFPDNIMVYFNEEFRLRLYAKLKETCGTRDEIARRLESNKETIKSSLFLGERDGHKSYTFVRIVKKIVEVFGLHLGNDFLNEMDKNVVAYRSWNGWSVTNPLLPIRESPQLYSIVFHLNEEQIQMCRILFSGIRQLKFLRWKSWFVPPNPQE